MNAVSKRRSQTAYCPPSEPGRSGAGLSGLLLLGLWAVSGPALSVNVINHFGTPPANFWPGEGSNPTWVATHTLDDAKNDVGTAGEFLNFVGDSSDAAFYTARYGNYLYFRMRTAIGVTTQLVPPYAPYTGLNTIFLFVQNATTTGSNQSPQYSISWDMQDTGGNHGMELEKLNEGGNGGYWWNTNFEDIDGNDSRGAKRPPDINSCGRTTDGYIRTVDQQSTTTFGNTTFVDFAVSCQYLADAANYSSTNNTFPGCTDYNSSKLASNLLCSGSWYLQVGSTKGNDHTKIQWDVAKLDTQLTESNGLVPSPLNGGAFPTYALIGDFTASVRNGQVIVEWGTQVEAGTLGFELDRQNALGEFEPVHQGLISGYGPAGEGGSYRVVDPTALPGFIYTYRLTEVEANGNRREVGQYTVTPEAKVGKVSAASAPMQLFPGEAMFTPRKPNAAEKARLAARRAERAAVRESRLETGAAAMAAPNVAQGMTASGASVTDKAAIGVKEAGLYYVSAAQLEEALAWPAGKAAQLIRTGQLRLTNQGKDIAWLAAPLAEGLYFYGQASRSIYDVENVYVLRQGPGTPMAGAKVRATGPIGADHFPITLTVEENRFAATVRAKDSEEDYWHWAIFNAANDCADINKSCRAHEFTLAAPGAERGGAARLIVHLRGNSSLVQNPDHRLAVTLNGTPIGEGHWDGLTDASLSFPFDQSLLKEAANTVRVEALLDSDVAYNYFYLDRFELSYQRRYEASQDRLQASGAANRLLVASGYSSNTIQVFDLTDPRQPRVVSGAKVQGTPGNYQVAFVPAGSKTRYLMVADSAVQAPSSLRAMQATGLAGRGAGAQYLVLAPEEFADASLRLVDFRSNQGLSGKFVPLQAIYDQYGAGQKTPHAIRKFLANALLNWETKPKYVVLGGKGTFDPKDYLGTGTDRLPVLMALTEAGVIAADQRFVDRDGNGLGDIPIGRLPAVTAAEFTAMVDKIIGYETAAATRSRRVVLLADGPDSGGDYTADSEAMAEQLLQAGYADDNIQRLYLEKMPVATLRTNLLEALNSGVGLLNYFGHSGTLALDHGLLTAADVASLSNKARLPLVAGMTCFMNRFEYPNFTSLGETLLLSPNGGAVAVWSAGGWSYSSEARSIANGMFEALFERGANTLGDAALESVLRQLQSANALDVLKVYNFIGDPASHWEK